ncbi:O-antigen ligase [Thiobacillus sp.]|uniref:O-antigen ligase family protein n=1 Tax=Thiobacillus sp. TaxID=924 RepID=UPI0025DAB287|nr:O-antigen ligase family protein [Thiobacillus sp.]MBT9538264.1 O-antigen ligase family protein [Thiobacillus sp.]
MGNTIFAYLFGYGLPFGVVIGMAVVSILALGLFIAYPKYGALPFFAAVLIFVNTAYGIRVEDIGGGFSVYSKGGRYLPFPIIQFYLYGLLLATWLGNQFSGYRPLKQSGGVWMLLFVVMFAGHITVGLFEGEHWQTLLSQRGLMNVIHMIMVIYIVATVLKDDKDLAGLTKIFLGVAVYHALYGLGRFFLFGGDPQNAYENLGGLNIKITYWDINEGLIATVSAFYFAWRLTHEWKQLSTGAKWLFLVCLAAEILVIVFSFRRTNWFGLLLAGAFFLYWQPPNRRWIYFVLGVAVVLPSLLAVGTYRAEETLNRTDLTFIERIAPDSAKAKSLTDKESRFFELYAALQTVKEKPLFGVGTWGSFKVGASEHLALLFHQGRYDFVHSGFGHVLLKSGLVGLVLFTGILVAVWRFASRMRRWIPENRLAIFESFRAGFVFFIPNLLTGTPVAEFRTMIWLGLVLAVPLAIAKMSAPREQASQPQGAAKPTLANGLSAQQ